MIGVLFRTVLAYLAILFATVVIAGAVVIAGMLGFRNRPGSIFDLAPRLWSRIVMAAAGVRVVVHGGEHREGPQHIFVGNHSSWFDVFAMAAHLRWVKFVAKAELFKLPIFGPAMRYAGMIPIERTNQSRARASIDQAGVEIKRGASVILFPEGTRGRAYALRPFKKGAFVLAIETAAPIVPVAIHGTLEIQPKGAVLIRPGRIDLHFLPPIDTAGWAYEDRNALAEEARSRIAACLEREYGVVSPG
ncbi:MAG: lysophospholipid acyltransferase family protein [Gemmatimonadaceae bacterium]|nr:lysophospholipid acyltransferase family protein [Gemmatimonadaceae bacterium]